MKKTTIETKQAMIQAEKNFNQDILTMYRKHFDYSFNPNNQFTEINDDDDVFQESMLELLENKELIDSLPDKKHLIRRLNKRNRNNLFNKYSGKSITDRDLKLDMNFETIENLTDTVFDETEKTTFQDSIDYIKQNLPNDMYQVFDMYFLQDMTAKQIGKNLNVSTKAGERLVKKLVNKLHRLKITELYNHRYLMTGGSCKGKYKEVIPVTENNWIAIDKKGFKPAKKRAFDYLNKSNFINDNSIYNNTDYAKTIDGDVTCLKKDISNLENNPVYINQDYIPYSVNGRTFMTWLTDLARINNNLDNRTFKRTAIDKKKHSETVLILMFHLLPLNVQAMQKHSYAKKYLI